MATPSRVLSGIGLTVLAVACFATLDSGVKHLSLVLPMLVVVWFRYAVQAVLMGGWLMLRGGARRFRVQNWRFQVLRGMLLLLTSVLAFYALRVMPLAEFTAVVMLSPIFVTLLAPWVLRERVSALRWALVVVAFSGALLVIRPGSGLFGAAALLPLMLAWSHAFFQLLTSRMSASESPMTTHFYTGAVGAAVLSLALPMQWGEAAQALERIGPAQWGVLAVVALMGTFGHLAFIYGLGRAPAAVLMPFTYAQIAFATLWGWVLFSQAPDAWAVAGMGLIAGSGAASVWLNLRARSSSAKPVHADTWAE
ncbi:MULTISPECIES: DMT family transporter [Caldimonas]|uniref:DMT family transporter n=1 Tax=Caldimonas TaxID=196013 RepID=UPI0004774194|nr:MULTISPECIES: DMT family transporter [Caldimonas]